MLTCVRTTAYKQVGQDLDDWIIIFTADHGEMLGEHCLWEKKRFFEGSARVPLLIRWPRGFDGGRRVSENVNHCDLFATLCSLCGLPIPDGLDSRDMTGLLGGDASGWDDESVCQFRGEHLMIKRGALKYQYYGESIPEVLFDLQRDPGETRDFMGDAAYADPVAGFRRRRDQLGFGPGAETKYRNAGYT